MKNILNTSLLILLILISLCACAQIPAGYYDDANGKTGYTLKTSLHGIIDGHTNKGYGALWTLYETSDKRADGYVWDIYSDCNLEFVTDQDPGSGGTVECDKFNREHTFPQSWFGGSGIMRNDPFHVLPTDKRINSVRGNFAYGEVSNPSYTSLNGSKLGPNTIAGYSGTVFEPIDEYKGDLARGYFYMATRYENIIASWENNDNGGDAMLDGSSGQVFEDWALQMLISWHNADPVSQKEIDRNDAIYDYQDNRNPFIDHPEYVSSIWGGGSTSPTINITSSLTNFGAVAFGEVSASQSYTVSGTDLTSDISITSDNGFQISLTDIDANYTTSLALSPSSGNISATTIFVRFKPLSDHNSAISSTLTHASSGVATQAVQVNGTEYYEVTPEINFSFSSRRIDPVAQYEVQLFASEAPNDDLTILIGKDNSTGLTYGESYTTTPTLISDVVEVVWLSGQLNASFLVDFETGLLGDSGPVSLDFSLSGGTGYTIGTNDTFTLTIKGTGTIAGVEEYQLSNFKAYPNPTNGIVTVSWTYGKFDYSITDLTGKVLKSGFGENTEPIDVSFLKSGQYILQVTNQEYRLTRRFSVY